jgi:hypothetical protein
VAGTGGGGEKDRYASMDMTPRRMYSRRKNADGWRRADCCA